jgi:hypothetical protein
MLEVSIQPDKECGAVFSPCEKYRYLLWRTWDCTLPKAVFIGLNPSTATATTDDPTVAKCQRHAKIWGGYGGIFMLNIFAYRATDPKVMKQQTEPVGPDNDEWIKYITKDAPLIIAKWGNHGAHLGRSTEVCFYLKNLSCLKIAKTGEPMHLLYLPYTTKVIPYKRDLED